MRKVKNWRGSTAAKIIAWIALSASALCFVFSAVGVIFMFDEGIYRNSKDETRKQWFENVSYEYGLSAVDDVRREQPAGSVESKYFKYGIIKADSLEGIDLNDEKSYAERNFSDKISLEDVYTNSVELSDEDQIVYTNGNFLTGGGVQLMYSGDNSWVSVYADRVCYDEAKGVFVYLAGNEYYPVQTIETDIDGYGSAVFTYDTERKMYLFEHTDGTGDAASAERTAADGALTDVADGDTVAESTEEPLTDVTDSGMDDIANGEYVTFDMFDGTRMDVNHWGNVLLDGVREISMDEIDRVDSSEKNKEDASVSYTTHEDYYLDSNYTLWVNMGNTSPKTTYQMVVILPQNVGTDWNSTDLYVQANTLLNFVYSMRYTALVTMFVSFIIGAAAFVFLMCAAGHRNGTDEIVTTVWDHLWLDVFAVGAVLAEVFVFYVAAIFLINVDVAYLPFILFVTAVATLCMGWLLLLFLLSFSVRVKLGKWWRHTLCYQLFRKIGGQPVVAVHKLDIFAVGQRNALIAGIRCAGVGFIHQCNAVVAGGKGAADGKGVVGGAIVQQQDLNAFISLGADAFDTAGNAPGSVVHGHDDAYKGKFHRFSFSQMRLWVRANASESFCTGPLGRGLSNRLR